tara:strand:+ start:14014 stop:14562 length:549 start_codon:yes stop_codon:yes gene_type:complete
MRYGKIYEIKQFDENNLKSVLSLIDRNKLEDSKITSKSGHSKRSSKNMWIRDINVLKSFLNIAQGANKRNSWDFHLDNIEPLQYAEYSVNDEFDWHVDQKNMPYSDNRVRKISFSILLNDDFEGGEFDLEVGNPNEKERYETIYLNKYQALFFQSDWFHRVQPITKGVRKSLVGWVLGPKFR